MNPKHIQIIANALSIRVQQVENTVQLLTEGATIPFISRYRKEVTGSLDEVQVGEIKTQYQKLQELEKRREAILKSIEEQGKMTDDLRKRIEATYNLTELEDIYLPYKQKRKTRASVAREKGLEPLALELFSQKVRDVETLAMKFLTDQVESIDDALAGARDIIAEMVNEDEKARATLRSIFSREAVMRSKVVKSKEAEAAKYKDYFDFSEPLSKSPSHRLLAMRRGEEEGFLRVGIAPADEEYALQKLEDLFLIANNESADQVQMAIADAYERLLEPSIETEFRNLSKDKADAEAITVFVENLRQLLLQAPLGQRRVMGIDPGFRTGCKIVCLDASGNLKENATIYLHNEAEAIDKIKKLVTKHQIEAIAIGNGTAGRETESLCQSISFNPPLSIFSVNEAGASIYSASEVAREEFPDYDVTVRGSVSIARRLMDPLAELVKIDPKSIGVGQYQHDVNQSALKESLDRTVESCVNSVGVNLNTASKHLLTYVSGLGPSLAQNIVTYRAENGAFKSRSQLKKVPRLGEKAFEQCAGFLRIREAEHPLDNSAVHPESYAIVEAMAKDLGVKIADLIQNKALRQQIKLEKYVTAKVGLPTLTDILKELDKPGLDPRGEAKAFSFGNVHKIEDLTVGMILPGIVTNITAFGAFVDIGVKQDGLVHISQMSNRFIKNPNEVVKLRQEVEVKVMEVDALRKRVTLSMKDV
ncbi:MAG: RNA-binding transcriptional accessory protein [Saprospiraceae bacterium]|nr:RNA-binding transcriptional accessory protein [Saprospiraceae bacterium]